MHIPTPTDTTAARPSGTVHPHTPGPTEGLTPQAPATSGTGGLPAMTRDGLAWLGGLSSPGCQAPSPSPGPDPARTNAPAGVPHPAVPGSRPGPPPVAEDHARGAPQPTNDEAEPPAPPTKPQREESTVGAEEMQGPPQRTPTPTQMGEPGAGADQMSMQSADQLDEAAHGSDEALAAGQPDAEPKGPTPDTECEVGLHRPSGASLANLALRADATTPEGAPQQDPPETPTGSETREATPDTP